MPNKISTQLLNKFRDLKTEVLVSASAEDVAQAQSSLGKIRMLNSKIYQHVILINAELSAIRNEIDQNRDILI